MPLLMIEPDRAALPTESDLVVPGGEVRAIKLGCGQLLAVTDLEGGQPAGLFAVSDADPEIFLSPHHTRVFSNSFALRLGMRLVTNKRRPVMVLGVSAPHLVHDLLMPLTEGEPAGADALKGRVAAVLHEAGARVAKVADPVNLFLSIAIRRDGSLTPAGVSSRPGDILVFRAVMDLTLAIAAPRPDPRLWQRPAPGPLRVQVRNDLDSIVGLPHRE
ncbi:MAG TPA: urea carboxylase-associated family protein [Xanthobacteraceae bacterium]|nr:urea carboxylase-associated family protein [Xanthobacteraceae bacterium]